MAAAQLLAGCAPCNSWFWSLCEVAGIWEIQVEGVWEIQVACVWEIQTVSVSKPQAKFVRKTTVRICLEDLTPRLSGKPCLFTDELVFWHLSVKHPLFPDKIELLLVSVGCGNVCGNVWGNAWGDVWGNVREKSPWGGLTWGLESDESLRAMEADNLPMPKYMTCKKIKKNFEPIQKVFNFAKSLKRFKYWNGTKSVLWTTIKIFSSQERRL